MRHRSKRSSYIYDHITNLPESLTSDILSRLTTKDAVRTSILSKAWQHKWASSCNVFIDEMPCRHHQNKLSFINAMNKILHPSNHLRSFQLSISDFFNDQTTVQTWIPLILTHKLEHLEIIHSVADIVYPSCLLNSTSLRKLWISHIGSNLCIGVKNLAPNLTTLYLSKMKFVNENPNTSTVKFDFPVLEKFTLICVNWVNVKSVEICAPSLTTFTSGIMTYDWDDEFIITVVSTRLTRFVCSSGVPEVFIPNGSSVASAVLCYEDYESQTLERSETIGLRVNNLVNGFTSLEELDLSLFAVEAILSGPRFHKNVTRLRLHGCCSTEQLLALLHAMPSLKFLVVKMDESNKYDYEEIESVPSCIVSQLEEVVLRFFEDKVTHYDLARFLSKNANELKKLTVVTGRKSSKLLLSTVRQHLSTFTRRSQMLNIYVRKFLDRGEFGSYPYVLSAK